MSTMNDWILLNQRYLNLHLARVRGYLQACMENMQATQEPAEATEDGGNLTETETEHTTKADAAVDIEAVAAHMPAPAALDTLCEVFSLSPFERDVLLLSAGMELDAGFASACHALQGNPQRHPVNFSLALAVLPNAHWSAVTPSAPLRRWRLIEIGSGETLTTSSLRIDERILHYLTGIDHPDERLRGVIKPLQTLTELPSSHKAVAKRVTELWTDAHETYEQPLVQLCGAESKSRIAIAVDACTDLGIDLYMLQASDIPQAAGERQALSSLWERDAAISRCALFIEVDELDTAAAKRAVSDFAETIHGLLIISSNEPVHSYHRSAIRLNVARPGTDEQYALWRRALGEAAKELNGDIEQVIAQFRINAQDIQDVGERCRTDFLHTGKHNDHKVLWDACRRHTRTRMNELAQRIEPAASWDDLVLPEAQLGMLQDIAAHVRQRTRVYETWGFAAKCPRGLGISTLFAGASGTGKTMAAEVLANELRLDLYCIDLSRVVSKYIGETEKNLRRVFEAAEQSGAILLFDEADALFGKRSEVKDSHDRYANIEVSYLLQKMEAYHGLAILTTNRKSAVDNAFLRRIRFVVDFPFPDAHYRAQIWQRIFPEETPTKGLDPSRLAQMNITGGNIRNIALNAAFLAADAGEPVQPQHLLRAAVCEYTKLEKRLTESELAGWS